MKKKLKKFLKTVTNRKELWLWITWTFFKDEFLKYNRETVGENLEFGKLLQRKETTRVLLELQKDYKEVVHGHVALSVINDLLEINERGRLSGNGRRNVD
jgi:hypothetical protein